MLTTLISVMYKLRGQGKDVLAKAFKKQQN